MLIQSEKAQVVAIDEVQFFDNDLPTVCSELAKRHIIIAGLDMDSLQAFWTRTRTISNSRFCY